MNKRIIPFIFMGFVLILFGIILFFSAEHSQNKDKSQQNPDIDSHVNMSYHENISSIENSSDLVTDKVDLSPENNKSQIFSEGDPLLEKIQNEINANIERGGLTLGDIDYSQGKTLATRDRVNSYSASINPIGNIKLFDGFEVSPNEIQEKAETIKMTALVTHESIDPNKNNQLDETNNENVIIKTDTIDIKNELDNGTLSMLVYDQALFGALDSIIDSKLINSFLDKNNLAPKAESIKFQEHWNQNKLILSILIDGKEFSKETFPGITMEEYQTNMSDIKEDIINSLRFEMGMSEFQKNIDQMIPTTDKKQYFSDSSSFSTPNVIAFLRNMGDINKQIPNEMRELISQVPH